MAAFVANNAVPRADLPALFEGLHAALKRLADGGEVAPAAIEPPAPAVSIRKSVTPDYLICLEDGKRFKSLRRHLAMLGMTPEQYRAKWNLPSTYPMVAPNYAAQRSALAKNIGFGLREKPVAAPPASAGESETVAGDRGECAGAGERQRDRGGGGQVGDRRHDRGGYSRADERRQAQSQGQEQGGRGPAGGPGKTQTRSPAQGDGVSKLRKLADDRPKPIRAGSVFLSYCESQREMERARHRMKALDLRPVGRSESA